MSKRDSFKGSGEGWEGLVGGLVKNPTKNKGEFDDGTGGGGPPKGDRQPRYRKLEALPPAQKEIEEKKMTGATTTTPTSAARPNPAVTDNMEPCPVCGGQKYKEATFTEDGVKKTVKILVCAACTARFRQYQEGVRADNVKFLVANPTAPEPAGPKSKFEWVLSQIDLAKFAAEAQTAETAYRAKYDETVVAVLSQRSYLVGAPEWKGTGTSRPVMRFTNAAFNGNGPALKQALEDSINKDLRWAMRKATGRLETATRVKAELEAELAKKAATVPTPPAADTATGTTATDKSDDHTVKVKPSAKKPGKKQQ